MPCDETTSSEFEKRFHDQKLAHRYRDRYRTGRHARVDRGEKAALRRLLAGVGRLSVAVDLPCGAGRLSPILAESADRVILADTSSLMLDLAREEPLAGAEYLRTNAGAVDLPDRSVDLVFCHRLLHHIREPDARLRILRKLARVARRFVVLSWYPSGIRTHIRYALKRLVGRARVVDRPWSHRQMMAETDACGLAPAGCEVLRRFPFYAAFLLFLVRT